MSVAGRLGDLHDSRLAPVRTGATAVSLLAAVGALLLGACGPPAPTAIPLQPEDFTLRGVPAEVDSAEIRLTFGDPDSIVESPNPFADSVPLTTWIYDGFEVRFGGEGPPIGYMIFAPGEQTARGLAVGDPVRRLLDLYGEPATRLDPSWTYAAMEDESGLRVIDFTVESDTVKRIYVGRALR